MAELNNFSRIKAGIKRLFPAPLVWPVWTTLKPSPGTIVLMYHRVGPSPAPFDTLDVEIFRAQMQWLSRHCRLLHPDELQAGAARSSRGKPKVLVTFDDGYRNTAEYAYPILDELKIPAVVFLATEAMDNGALIWTEWLEWVFHKTELMSAKLPYGGSHDLTSADDKKIVARSWKKYLKGVTNGERLAVLDRLVRDYGVPRQDERLPRQMLTWDEVRASPACVIYGGHTHSHPIMSQLDTRELDAEVALCSRRIEDETAVKPRHFAYPNGRREDFNASSKTVLRRHGFDLIYSTIEGLHLPGADMTEIRRLPTTVGHPSDFPWFLLRYMAG